MATRALLYRRPAEPSRLLVKHGSQIYSVRLRRHRRARRYTLRIHPSDREAILTMPPRARSPTPRISRSVMAAGSPRVLVACRRPHRSTPVPSCRCAALRIASCIGRACAARCGTEVRDSGERISLRRRRRRAYRPAGPRLPQASGARRIAEGGAVLCSRAGRQGEAAVDPRSVEPLGFVHLRRLVVVLVAADPRAALRARLSRRP